MKKIVSVLQVLLGLVIIAGLGFFLYKLIVLLIDKIDKINANIFVALIAGSVTIIGFFITRYLERKKIIEQQIREQKLPTYEEFIDFIFALFKSEKLNKKMSEKELQEFYWKFNKKAILWLSDRTLKSYTDWRKLIVNFSSENGNNKNGAEMLIAFENLLLDFRKDIGHKNRDLKTGEILSMFINDWDKYSKQN